MKRFSINNDFFTKDTPESFYWAGFIAADGCVRLQDNKYKQLAIGLSIKDKKHLYKLKNATDFNGNILEIQNKVAQIVVSSSYIFDSLRRFNIVPRKTKIYTFPIWMVGHEHINHFMRGYFDGDGCVSKQHLKNTNIPQLRFHVLGTNEFLQTYTEILQTKCDLKKDKKIFYNNGIYRLEYGGNTIVRKIFNFLYNNSNSEILLERKYDIFVNTIRLLKIGHNGAKPIVGNKISTGELIEFSSLTEAGKNGFTWQCISKCCRGKQLTHNGFQWKYKSS